MEVPQSGRSAPLPAARALALADPDPIRARRLGQELQAQGHAAALLDDLEALGRYCATHAPVAVALPWHWPAAPPPPAGDSPLLRFLRAHGTRLAVVVYGPIADLPLGNLCQLLAAGAKQVLNERAATFAADLAETLGRLVRHQQARAQEEEQLCDRFASRGLVGRGAALQQVFRRAVKASCFSDLPVLLLGETGTGKQLLAEAIHALDPRRADRPFVTVNCSAVNKTLAESELFGHTRGAFSGAQGERLGLFRAANGGTLLLDEVGEIDLELQPKLLRVLQDRRLLPVGEDYEHPIDVRIIAATNRPLKELVAQGKFREDLYQRLNVLRIEVPPLRERPDDVAVQAWHFLESYQASYPTEVTGFGPLVLKALESLPWEGNSRQLRHLIWEALAHKEEGELLDMADLPHWVHEALAGAAAAAEPSPGPSLERAWAKGVTLTQAVEEYERLLLKQALKENAGNRARTAAMLGLAPRSIFNKIKKYQLE